MEYHEMKPIVAILAFNSNTVLPSVLYALMNHDLDIVIIDNGSEPAIKVPFSKVEVHRFDKSIGIIHGRNYGFWLGQQRKTDVLAIADDVVVPEGDWLSVMKASRDRYLALRPKTDIAFTEYQKFDNPDEPFIAQAPTSFQCVYFPYEMIKQYGYVDERYIWGDDGLMMMKMPHGVVKDYYIETLSFNRGNKYSPLRTLYEGLWRPGKDNMPDWKGWPCRYSTQEYISMSAEICDTIWNEKSSEYHEISKHIMNLFEYVWDNPWVDLKGVISGVANK
jgi:hypothetical protein